ncbi:MAG: hypothetical protein A2269_01725 [Lentisphaerae bacterium RIFOXYA12_FULL_60_10]|nr:MAG: hypothetical protein A2269_01725 [Lentisphaerae bacterium RIFOXYA12_FULL_60_10]
MQIAEAVESLTHAFRTGRVANAYLVEGPLRSAGVPLAEKVLATWLCEQKNACGQCRTCEQVRQHQYADLFWMEPEKKSRKFGVDRVRDMRRYVSQTSFVRDGWKAMVVVGADRLGQDSSNTLLKILEEPPARTVFFLLSDSPQSLLPTVLSRCQRIRLSAPEPADADLQARLAEILQAGDGAWMGAYGRANRLSALLAGIKQAVSDAEEQADDGDGDETESRGVERNKQEFEARVQARYLEERERVLRGVQEWYRVLLLAVTGADASAWGNQFPVPMIRERSAHVALRQALRNVQVVEQMKSQLALNVPELNVLIQGFSQLS